MGPSGVRWDDLYLSDHILVPILDDDELTSDHVVQALLEEQLEDQVRARHWMDGQDPIRADAARGLRRPMPSDLARNKIHDLIEWGEDHEGHVLDVVRGINYEHWAMNNYCFSLPHARAGYPCVREFRVPRWNLGRPDFFDNPQPLMKARPDGSAYRKHRRHDCHCPGAPEQLPPISLEAKATSRPDHARYSPSYERHLVEQCLDYRFTLTKLYAETFSEVGRNLRQIYERLLLHGAVGQHDEPGIAANRRPILRYHLSHDSPALRRVMERCKLEALPGDDGLMPTSGAYTSVEDGRRLLSVAERLLQDPRLPVSAMQWARTHPGSVEIPDAVRQCNGEIQYYTKRMRRVTEEGETYDWPELHSLCIGAPYPNELYWRRDNLVDYRIDPTLRGQIPRYPEWGNLRLPIIGGLVCPPETISSRGRELNERILQLDGVQRLGPIIGVQHIAAMTELRDLFSGRESASLVRIPQIDPVNLCLNINQALCDAHPFCLWNGQCRPNPAAYLDHRPARLVTKLDWVLPGYHVTIGEDVWAYDYEEDMIVPWINQLGDISSDWSDADERRDLCFD